MAPRSKRRRRVTHVATPPWQEGSIAPDIDADSVAASEQRFTRYYYDVQRIARDKDDFDACLAALRRPLPVCLRVNRTCSTYADSTMDQGLRLLRAEHTAGARGALVVPPATYFPWVGAWQLDCDSKLLKQAGKHAPASSLGQLHDWIVENTKQGLIVRQELVSMLPVACLDIRAHHSVLDMCASPGSKSTQALDALHADSPLPRGCLVANELRHGRSYVLANRCMALGPACLCVGVTTHRAQIMPSGSYDRVICDVPCSGDGTFRKYPEKWCHYRPYTGRALHSLQLQIAMRGAAMTTLGGVLCYSTCSLDPLENEAVVNSLLSRTGGAFEVIPPPVHVTEALSLRPGLTSWAVCADDGEVLRFADCRVRGSVVRRRFRRSMWPPASQSQRRLLATCVRLYPHDNNTGGFFLALLRKRSPLPWEAPQRPRTPTAPALAERSHVFSRVPVESLPDSDALAALAPLLDQHAEDLVLCARGHNSLWLMGMGLWNMLTGQGVPCQRTLKVVRAGVPVAKRERKSWVLTRKGREILSILSSSSSSRACGGRQPPGLGLPQGELQGDLPGL